MPKDVQDPVVQSTQTANIHPPTGALIAGFVALGAVVVWGVKEAGVVAFVLYRLFRSRPSPASWKEGIGHAAEAALGKLGKGLVGPASGVSMAIRAAEFGAMIYGGYRALEKQRSAAKRAGAAAEEEKGPPPTEPRG